MSTGARLGCVVALLHRTPGPALGGHRDNNAGRLDVWRAFYADRRFGRAWETRGSLASRSL